MQTFMIILLTIGSLFCGGFVVIILLKQHNEACRDYAVLGLFCAMLMQIAYVTELRQPDFSAKVVATQFAYIGKVLINPMLLMFIVRYYKIRLNYIFQVILFIIPLATLFFVFRCPQDHTYYREMWLSAENMLETKPGAMYFVYMFYNAVLGIVYLCLCIKQRRSLRGRDLTNNTLLISAAVIPLAFLIVYLTGVTGGYDITCIGVMIGSLLIAYSIQRLGILDKEEMLDYMTTGLVFLDKDGNLMYANRCAAKILPTLGIQIVQTYQQKLPQLLSKQFEFVQIGTATYQRRISEWKKDEENSGILVTFDDVTEMRARLNLDAMTGLLNHAAFYPMLAKAMEKHSLTGAPVSVSIADIDRFKRINDTYGHANGDLILIALADTLRNTVGSAGDVFRYGGEEFAVIFKRREHDSEEIMQQALEEFSAMRFDFLPYHVTFSYGTAEYDRKETGVELFDRADQLMYVRKKVAHDKEDERMRSMGKTVEQDSRL